MTKTIIAIGLGLLAAIYAPGKTVLAQTPVALGSGYSGVELVVLVLLHEREGANCAVKGRVHFSFPENGRPATTHEFELDGDAPFASMSYAFQPEGRGSRESAAVSMETLSLEYSSPGKCRFLVGVELCIEKLGWCTVLKGIEGTDIGSGGLW